MRSGFLVMLTMILCRFHKFDVCIVKRAMFGNFCFCRFQIPQPLRMCRSCPRLFGSLRTKTPPWNFGTCLLWILWTFVDFRPPKPFAAVSQPPAPLPLPQKKHGPGILEHVSCGCCRFLLILGSWVVVRLCGSAVVKVLQ